MEFDYTLDRSDTARLFLGQAWKAAGQSNDPNTQNGALVWGRKARCNYVPNYTIEEVAEMDRDTKLSLVVHAEVNALLAAGDYAEDNTLYVLWYACSACASAICASRVSRVVGLKRHFEETPERWIPKVQAGLAQLKKGGVKLELYDGPIDMDNTIMFNGEVWDPK